MKILRVRFQNLNSLSGIWDIDFTDPAYTENNIFAITGPTGAGKSTLLDAICLALYGATPRLGKITKTSNEIMSRHTGICFTEVAFSTTKGSFRCHWSQHRSRQKPNGELQQPKHEIANAANGNILESSIRNVANKVEEVTGMDFERFTRSTLLAQGGFAVFLQASANERAPILEQITGTEIYSQLSMKVHELQGLEQLKLKDLEQSLTHINLLTPEAEEKLNISIIETKKESVLCKTMIDKLSIKRAWLETIERLTSEKDVCLKKLILLNEETQKKSAVLERLQPALIAKTIEPLFQEVNALLGKQKDAVKEQHNLEKEIAKLAEKQKVNKIQSAESEKLLFKTKHSRETGLSLIRDVEALDHKILATKNSLREQTKELSVKQTSQTKEQTLLNTIKQKFQKIQNHKAVLESFLKEHACDESLPADIEAIRIKISTLSKHHEQKGTIAKAEKEIRKQHQKSLDVVTKLNQTEVKLENEIKVAKTRIEQLQEANKQILQGREPNTLQQALFRIHNRQKNLKNLLQLMGEKDGITKKLAALHKEITIITEQKATTEQKQQLSVKEKTAKQKEIGLLEKNILLLHKILTLEEDRQLLQDHAPCPLCGSTKHPYSHGNIPETSLEESLLEKAQRELSSITEESDQLTRKSIIAGEKLKNCSKQIVEIEDQIKQSEKCRQQLLSELELPAFPEYDARKIEREWEQLNTEQHQLEIDYNQLEKHNKESRVAEKAKDKLLTSKQQLKLDHLTATHNATSLEQKEKNLRQEMIKISESLVCMTNSLLEETQIYGIESINTEKFPFILKELEQRSKKWQNNKDQAEHLSLQIIKLVSELEHKKSLHKSRSKEIQDYQEKCRATQEATEDIIKKRTDLFGDKEPLKESHRLEQKVAEARREYDGYLQKCNEIEKKLATSNALLDRLQKEISTRKNTIHKQEKLFNKAILDSSFSDSQEFLHARLSCEELDSLQKLQNRLKEEKAELTALHKDKEATLQLEKEKQLSQKSTKELQNHLDELKKQLESFQEKTIAAKEQLKINSSSKAKSKEQLETIASQKKVVGRWNRLHMLIGSADGKKFRNFAQGLTFEMMVAHANFHLSKMNNRYILVRDLQHPLDLNVIDTYQADEIRSTKNLSGGESFLVSLALALGLSRMASQNVRVDSLFLDEGFGTLDEDALESALNTLSGLHDENKLIGIISHVIALKERIPLQIEIIPGGNGKSSIRGPGVKREVL
jgi:exonuclease SbcC